MSRSLKFCIQIEAELYCLCSEEKGADQLCSYCTAGLRFFSPHRLKLFFMSCGSIGGDGSFLHFQENFKIYDQHTLYSELSGTALSQVFVMLTT